MGQVPKPVQVICLDHAFQGNDQLKTNIVLEMESRDIQFRTRVTAAHYHEGSRSWTVTAQDGSMYRTRFMITAIGPLSAPIMPRIEGVDSFEGQSFHTARWPHDPVDFNGKRVAVIGTGASANQIVPRVNVWSISVRCSAKARATHSPSFASHAPYSVPWRKP
jgi:cation diffusion facilitator CzcD-associated flavoprotein CzcO